MFRGYIEATREIEEQLNGKIKFDDIVVACGRFCFLVVLKISMKMDALVVEHNEKWLPVFLVFSGGTLVGLSLGSWLSTLKAKVRPFFTMSLFFSRRVIKS